MLEKKPFVKYRLDEEKVNDASIVISVRLNKDEMKILNELKEDLNVSQDGKALKIGAIIGRNVLHATFSKQLLGYLFKKDRSKLEDFKNF